MLWRMETNPAERLRAMLELIRDKTGGRRGWQREIAEILGLNPSHISRILGGYGPEISDRVVQSICERTGIRRDYFVRNPDRRPFTEFVSEPDMLEQWAGSHELRRAGGLAASMLYQAEQGRAPMEIEVRELVGATMQIPPFSDASAYSAGLVGGPDFALSLARKVAALQLAVTEHAGGGPLPRVYREVIRRLASDDPPDSC